MSDLLPILVGAVVGVVGYASGAAYTRWLLRRLGGSRR